MNTKHDTQSTSVNTSSNSFANSVLSSVFSSKQKASGLEFSKLPASKDAKQENADMVNSILSRLESKREKAAVNLRLEAEEVEALPFDLSALETEGIFLNIDTHGFGSLTRQLDWKSLGVKLPENRTVLVSPPRAGLLPNKYRRKLMLGASQAHNALKKYSFSFTLCETVFGTSEYKWIPWNAFEQFEGEYKKACETLAVAKAEVLEKYDDILITLREDFAEIAEDSAKRFEATLDMPFDRNEFRTNVVAHAMGMIPSREVIRDSLTIGMKPKVIVLGSEMIAEQQKTHQLNLESEKIEADRQQVRLELDTKTRIEQLKVEDFEQERRRERETKERIRQMKIETAREAADEAVSPIKEGLEQITSKLYEAACDMAEKLQSADFVPGALAKRAREMCGWYQLMNFTNDSSLEEVLTNLERAAGRDAKVRSTLEMRGALSDVMRATTIQSKRLLDEDRLLNLEI